MTTLFQVVQLYFIEYYVFVYLFNTVLISFRDVKVYIVLLASSLLFRWRVKFSV